MSVSRGALTRHLSVCETRMKLLNIWRENQNQNARFFVISHFDLAVNRIVHFGTGSHCFLLTNTRCLLESPQSYSCSTWKRFDWRDSNHAIRSRLVFISMLANTKCPGNGIDLKHGNDLRNAIVSEHFHACQHKLSRKWKLLQEWKWLQECKWGNNFVICHKKQECWLDPNPSCWCLLQKWNTLERTQTSFFRLKPENLVSSFTSTSVSFQNLGFLTLRKYNLRYIREFEHTFICGFWKIDKNYYTVTGCESMWEVKFRK